MSVEPRRVDSSKLSTLGAGAIIEEGYFPRSIAELSALQKRLKAMPIVLGGLSNTLVVSPPASPIIFTGLLKEIVVSNNFLYAPSGAKLAALCNTAMQSELGGLEKLSGIPGTVGGAIKNNSGCFGKEIADNTECVYLFDWESGKTVQKDKCALKFSYRHCALEPYEIILGASFVLTPQNKEEISACAQSAKALRERNQPKGKSLGSVFKKHNGVGAGFYIEQAGLKGYCLNGMEISKIHANFIVNRGGAAIDYLRLAEYVQNEVHKRFGIELTREVVVIGQGDKDGS